jgi:hypothetical protein
VRVDFYGASGSAEAVGTYVLEAKMKRRVALLPLVLLLGIVLVGCEPPAATVGANAPPGPPPPPGSEPAAAPAPPPAPAPAAQPNQRPIPLESKAGVFAGGLDDLAAPVSRPSSQPAAPPVDPNVERVKAEKGVGIKGRSLDEYEGVVVTPAKQIFTVRERVVFEIQIPGALNLFNASEGRNPESHEEFMEKIIKFNNIKLPELPPGQKYIYDPAQNELMVERPKLKSAP